MHLTERGEEMNAIKCKCGKTYNLSDVPAQIKCYCGEILSNFKQEKITKGERKFDFYKSLMKHPYK